MPTSASAQQPASIDAKPQFLVHQRVVLSPAEFAGLFGRSETWGYRQLYSGRVKAIQVSGRLLIPRSEVDRLLAEAAVYTGVPAQAPQCRGNRSARNINPGVSADEVGAMPGRLDFNRLLAECEAGDFRLSNGLTAMETYRGCVDRKTYLDRRRAVKGMVLTASDIDWQKVLPVGRLPADLPDADPQRADHQLHDSASRGDAKRPSRLAEESRQACGRTQSDEGAAEAEHDAAHRSTAATSSPSLTSVTSNSATIPISVFPNFQQQTQNTMNTPTTDPEDNTLEPQPAPISTAPLEPSTEPGLDPVVAATPTDTTSDRPAGIVNVIYIAVSALTPNPKNIAIYGDEEADDELVESIGIHGILAPLHATVDGVIVSGHRRRKAALKLGLEVVPVFLTEVNADPVLAEEQFLESNRVVIKR